MFWQQEVFGGPTRRFRSIKNCKPLAKFKDDYLNKRKIMITNMQGLAKIAAVVSKFYYLYEWFLYSIWKPSYSFLYVI